MRSAFIEAIAAAVQRSRELGALYMSRGRPDRAGPARTAGGGAGPATPPSARTTRARPAYARAPDARPGGTAGRSWSCSACASIPGGALFHRAWTWPSTTLAGSAGDADEYTWFLASALSPSAMASTRSSVTTSTSLRGQPHVEHVRSLPSFLMSPVTVVFGAAFSYNVRSPRHLRCAPPSPMRRSGAGRPAAALGGALVFGFSPYIVSQSVGHLSPDPHHERALGAGPSRPAPGRPDRSAVVGRLAPRAAGVAQLLTGEEVLALEAVTAAIAVAVLWAIARGEVSRHLAYAVRGLVVTAGVFVVLSAPFLAVQYLGPDKVQKRPPGQPVRDRPVELCRPHPQHAAGTGGGPARQLPFHRQRVRARCLHRRPPGAVRHPGRGPGPPPPSHVGGAGGSRRGRAAVGLAPTLHVRGHITICTCRTSSSRSCPSSTTCSRTGSRR